MRIVGVSELTGYLKSLLEEDYYLQDTWVRGEITNYTQSGAGHRYFSIKDERASIRCVLFRGNGFGVPALRNGMAVFVHGRISVYEPRGDVQFYVDAVEDAGVGELHLRFEALKARLEAEGLFAAERKRALPRSPSVIGVVTSSSAAALRDIVRTLRLRCPLARVVLAATLVQGEDAAEQVAAAIAMLNAHAQAEVIILARGGGSIEELWAFNEEIVARAIAASAIPVVTGIGHETDFTIADFVADLRASTPTAAATAVVPDLRTWRESLLQQRDRLDQAMDVYLYTQHAALGIRQHGLDRASPRGRLLQARQQVDEARERLRVRMRNLLEMRRERLSGRAQHLHALSPLLTLNRGFAVVRRADDDALVTSVAQVSPGERLRVRVADGTFAAIAGEHETPAAADGERE
ncbi:MAG TPA: exodeoxyribonuclease VII large subunit [Ktedonobacterales bacterium]|nr:exodeoxyribonuclease VII large subunit [Ktedonobacterales bacterium]